MNPSLHSLSGVWRVLALDASDPDDARWLLCTVDAVKPAVLAGRKFTDWQEVTEWVHQNLGSHPSLVPIGAMIWRVDERRQP